MSNLTFGLIGASNVAASRMVPAFQANGLIPKALFDTDRERFRYWREHDLDLVTTDLDELLDSDIDAVYISSATISMPRRQSLPLRRGSTSSSRSPWRSRLPMRAPSWPPRTG